MKFQAGEKRVVRRRRIRKISDVQFFSAHKEDQSFSDQINKTM
jgi:hypothetical protein